MKRDYKSLLREGKRAQIEKLKENDHKCGFDIEPIDILYKKLKEEMYELEIEVFHLDTGYIDYKKVRREAADVANFAFMIILKCVQILFHKRK